MQVKQEKITPVMAASMLARNPNNRHINPRRVEELAKAMKDGTFVENGDTIRFDQAGNLLDGQHRLTAAIRAGFTLTTLVVRGLPPSVMTTIDIGHKRSVSDSLRILGHQNYIELSSAAKLVKEYKLGFLGSNRGAVLTPDEAIQVLDDHPGLIASTHFILGRSTLPRVVSKKTSCFFHYVFSQIDPAKADDFFIKLATGVGLVTNHPVLKLREALMQSRNNPRYKLTTVTTYIYVIRAWNAFYAGKTLSHLRGRGGNEDFPLIAGCKLYVPAPKV